MRVLMLAKEMGVLQMRTVALDGTKIHANATSLPAYSWDSALWRLDDPEIAHRR